MATLLNSIVGYICVGRTCASSNGQKTVRLGACCAGDGALKTAVGYKASYCASGAQNTAFGARALELNTGGCNTAVGSGAMRNGSGDCNTAFGNVALRNLTTGCCNVGVGYYALKCVSSGSKNVGVGAYAGCGVATGVGNTFIGYCSKTACSSLNRAVAIGYNARAGYSYAVAIGPSSFADGTCAISIGNGACVTSSRIKWGAAVNNMCNCVWGTWSYISDCRDKADIVDIDDNLGINFIRKLKPVSYKIDNRQSYVQLCNYEYGTKDGNLKRERTSYGFIAQDVKDIADELNIQFEAVKYDEDMDAFRLSYSQLLASVVKTIKTIDQRIQVLKTKI
jgi:hypothetical protein